MLIRSPSAPPEPVEGRAGIYLRVSDKRQLDNHSLDDQERLARELAAREGWVILEDALYRDPARRGGTDRRPEFQRMLADVAAGKLDIVIVWHIDRFSREDESERHYKFLKLHGVRLVSLSQHLDEGTASGRLLRRIMADFSVYYSEDLGEKYRRGKKGRVVKGQANGDLAFGYRRNPVTRQDEPDPEDAEGVRLAFAEYAAGACSDLDIALLLNQRGYRTANKTGRRPFSKDTLRQLLQNRFYTGQVSYKGEWFPGKHPPLVDPLLFDRCQAVRAARRSRTGSVNHQTRPYPLGGLLVCQECGTRYRGFHHPRYGRTYYQPAAHYGRTCQQRATASAEIEADLSNILSLVRIPDDWRTRIAEHVQATVDAPALESEKQRTWLDERLRRAKLLFLNGDLTEAQYQSEKSAARAQKAELSPSPGLAHHTHADYTAAAELLHDFGQLYDLADPRAGGDEKRKRLFQSLFERVYLLGDEIAALQPHPAFYPLLLYACGPDEIRVPTRRVYHMITRIALRAPSALRAEPTS
jgi:DNA invertase Pin-like site-specific DNA recombinase